MTAWFVVEESSWAWNGESRELYVASIERLLDRIETAASRGEQTLVSRKLLEQTVAGQLLANLIWDSSKSLELDRDTQQRIAAYLSRARYWDDELVDFGGGNVVIDRTSVVSPSAAYAHELAQRGDAIACLPLAEKWKGPLAVEINGKTEVIHFVVDEKTHRSFFRDLVSNDLADPAQVIRLSSHAFPDVLFVDGVWDELDNFEGGYARVRVDLVRFFSALDDYGAWVFTDGTGRLTSDEAESNISQPVTNQLIERRFRRWGINVAPEKPEVRNDEHCKRARERSLHGRVMYCEWHFKIEPHVNRVHLSPPIRESNGRVIVAIFANHLPLPR